MTYCKAVFIIFWILGNQPTFGQESKAKFFNLDFQYSLIRKIHHRLGVRYTENLVIHEHPHEIVLWDAQNCKTTDNRIIPNPFNKYEFESAPWIMIANHKDGQSSHNKLIPSNLVSELKIADSPDVTKNNNLTDKGSQNILLYQHWIF